MTPGTIVTHIHTPQAFSFLDTHSHTHSPELGGAQESVAWGRLEGKCGVEYVILDNVG